MKAKAKAKAKDKAKAINKHSPKRNPKLLPKCSICASPIPKTRRLLRLFGCIVCDSCYTAPRTAPLPLEELSQRMALGRKKGDAG